MFSKSNLFPQLKSRLTFVKTRRLVETVIGQLSERFHLQTVRSWDLWHFTNRINRKILAHTLAFWINRHSLHPLQFEQIISD